MFDVLSDKNNIYKVETVKDCFVGVAGAPEKWVPKLLPHLLTPFLFPGRRITRSWSWTWRWICATPFASWRWEENKISQENVFRSGPATWHGHTYQDQTGFSFGPGFKMIIFIDLHEHEMKLIRHMFHSGGRWDCWQQVPKVIKRASTEQFVLFLSFFTDNLFYPRC